MLGLATKMVDLDTYDLIPSSVCNFTQNTIEVDTILHLNININ